MRIEKASYIRATSLSSRSAVAGRLSSCASTLRLVIEVSNRTITSKSVNALADHIIDSLPSPEAIFCEPIVSDYLRSLRTLLEYPPHTEHLRKAKWRDLCDFLLQCLSQLSEDGKSPEPGLTDSARPESRPLNRRSFSVLSSRQSRRETQHGKTTQSEELLLCLTALTCNGNHPTLEKAGAIGDCIIDYLEYGGASNIAHQAAFKVLNRLLSILVSENAALFEGYALRGSTAIRRIWSTKSIALKEEMIVTLGYFEELITHSELSEGAGTLRDTAERLLALIQADLTSRQEKDLWHTEDIALDDDFSYLKLACFNSGPRPLNAHSLSEWALLSITGTLVAALSTSSAIEAVLDKEEHPSKRRRILSAAESIIQHLDSGNSVERIISLQIIAVLLPNSTSAVTLVESHLDQLLRAANDDNAEVASWAFLVFSRYDFSPSSYRH